MADIIYILFSLFVVFIAVKITNKVLFTKRVGVIVLRRRTNKIYTSFSIKALKRYIKMGTDEFKKDCSKFFDELETGKIYATDTHSLILHELKRKNVDILYEKIKKKRVITTQLMIGNKKKLFKKRDYYKVYFIKKKEN